MTSLRLSDSDVSEPVKISNICSNQTTFSQYSKNKQNMLTVCRAWQAGVGHRLGLGRGAAGRLVGRGWRLTRADLYAPCLLPPY